MRIPIMNSFATIISWITLHWRIITVASLVAIAASLRSCFESEETRVQRLQHKKEKHLKKLAQTISNYGSKMRRLYPTGDVIISHEDLAEQLGKSPDAVFTALDLLLKEQKVQRAPLPGYWKLNV
jgi:hypothetical protein